VDHGTGSRSKILTVVAGGDRAVAPELVDRAFDDVAPLVVLGVEPGPSTASAAAGGAVADLVGGLGDGRSDAASSQLRADGARTNRIGLLDGRRLTS
jgi:hypothetical protein